MLTLKAQGLNLIPKVQCKKSQRGSRAHLEYQCQEVETGGVVGLIGQSRHICEHQANEKPCFKGGEHQF